MHFAYVKVAFYHIYAKYSDKQAWASSVGIDQMAQKHNIW